MNAVAKPARDPSLDGFRGVTVVLMMLVNFQPGEAAWPMLAHADWHGLTLADLVFPWFLLIVGMSVAFAGVGSAPAPGKAMRRSVLLFALGVVLAWLIRPSLEMSGIRWMGVLQRIAIVYIVCIAMARQSGGWRTPAAIGLLVLFLHSVLLHGNPPGSGAASLDPGEGMAGWLDQTLLPGRLYPPGYDPEGLLSSLGAVATGLAGLGLARASRELALRPLSIALAGLVMALSGLPFALIIDLPLNKTLWTPGFVLVTAGTGALLWAGLRAVWPHMAASGPARLFRFCGCTALTMYVVHMLLIAVLVRRLPDGSRIWDAGYGALLGVGLPPTLAALGFGLLATLLSILGTGLLARREMILRL